MPYELLILVSSVAVGWLTLKTHRFKSPIIRWALIVLLPLSLLGYAKLNIDIFTIPLFVPLLIATAWSLGSLFLLVLKLFTSAPTSFHHVVTRATRPILCICVVLTVRFLHADSLHQARIQAAKAAIEMQQLCNNDLRCPTSLPNWQPVHWRSSGNYWETRLGSSLAATYLTECKLDYQTYLISIRINKDEIFEIAGGVYLPFEVYRGPMFDQQKQSFQQAEELLQHLSELD
jgi:hypothetical protein